MAIQFHCPSCNALLSVDDQHSGKQVKCTHCQQTCTAQATAIQASAPAGPKADGATSISAGGPKRRRDDDEDDEPRRPRGPRRDAEPSSFPTTLIVLLVGGAVMLMCAAPFCVGLGMGFFFVAEERAIVQPMPPQVAEEVVVEVKPPVKAKNPPIDRKAIEKGPPGQKVAIATPREAIVKGTVKLRGNVPEVKLDARIKAHPDQNHCLSGPEKHKVEQVWLVGKDKSLANVVVSLAPPAGKMFPIDDELEKISKKTVTIDQPYCAFDPHVVALWPRAHGLVVQNSAPIPHNVKVAAPAAAGGARDFLIERTAKGDAPKKTPEIFFKGAGESVIDVTCGIHPWMHGKIALFTHPYFAVTREDGSFEIANVPIDEELTVYVWHESEPRKLEAMKLRAVKGANELKLVYPP